MTPRPPRRARFIMLWVLAGLIPVLFAANLWKHGLTLEAVGARKDALAATQSLLSIVAITVGGVLAYLQFFAGRTFSARGNLTLRLEVAETSEGTVAVVSAILANVGTRTIRWPAISGTAHVTTVLNPDVPIDLTDWHPDLAGDLERRALSVEPAESAEFTTLIPVPAGAQAIRCEVWARTPSRSWQAAAIVPVPRDAAQQRVPHRRGRRR